MDATRELLLEHGSADALSIRSITARAGVSPTALYLHFADKEELLRAVCDEAFEEFGDFHSGRGRRASKTRARRSSRWGRLTSRSPSSARASTASSSRPPGRFGIAPGPADEDPGMKALDALVAAAAQCVAPGHDPRAAALLLWTAFTDTSRCARC